jgi:uncharacterized membrane protein YhhN
MSSYFSWFGLPGTFVLSILMSLLALTLALLRPSRHRWLCAAAMGVSSLGDVFMTRFMDIDLIFPNYFIIGAAFFMLAHVLYILTYRTLMKKKGYRFFNGGVTAAVLMALACLIYFTVICFRQGNFGMFFLCMAYLVVITANCSFIFSYTVSDFKARPIVILAALGALSFFVSDLIIGLGTLANINSFGYLIWWFYPIGQILLITSAE